MASRADKFHGRPRLVSVGVSRLFRLVEVDGTIPADYAPNLRYYVEQAVKDPLTKKWAWHPRAMAHGPHAWREAHEALHALQAELLDEMQRRRGSFNAERITT